MKKYSIRETNLTNIGNALRTKLGDTKIIRVTETQQLPVVTVSKTPNATSFYTWEGTYVTSETEYDETYEDTNGKRHYIYDTITISGAISIKVKYRFGLTANAPWDTLQIGKGVISKYMEMLTLPTADKTGEHLTMSSQDYEVTFNNTDTITIRLCIADENKNGTNNLGYYAEVWGVDADGNPLETYEAEVEVDKEVPNTFSSAEMADAINSIGIIPSEAYYITGNCAYKFANGGWDWFVTDYGHKIITSDISSADNMFYSSKITEIPFEFNIKAGNTVCNSMFNGCENLIRIPSIDFKQTSYSNCALLFNGCKKLREVGTLKNIFPSSLNGMFTHCNNLRYLPEFENLNLSRLQTYASANISGMFSNCYSLRSVSEDFIKQFYGIWTSYIYTFAYNAFQNCYAIDEIKGFNPKTGKITTNMFNGTFSFCCRAKDVIFALQEDGTPYSVDWKSQTLDLSTYVGFSSQANHITDYNSGITADKEVTDDASYQALKDDPDWFTCNLAYSRYNHDSAVNTINSLPDVTLGSSNTIKFKGEAGSLTDGGAINTLTEEEIAVATAKGWTVTFA